jgi:hypothetical protein
MKEADMDPEISDFESALPSGPLTWIVFCLNEEGQVGGFFNNRVEATAEAFAHSRDTGHVATAAPILAMAVAPNNLDAEQLLSVPFCVAYEGRPRWTIVVAAPSPEAAFLTVDQFVAVLNSIAPSLGFLPRFSATLGACEVV